jgi:hypothetical protein
VDDIPVIICPSRQKDKLVSVGHHRSEFEHIKQATVLSHTFLAVKYGTSAIQPDRQGDQSQERQRENKSYRRYNDIEETLYQALEISQCRSTQINHRDAGDFINLGFMQG